jgi:Uma2 family endonuclease
MTGEEFFEQFGHHHMELVDGIPVKEGHVPSMIHGQVCVTIGAELFQFVRSNKLGRVCGNDTLIRLRRNPDTVRGPDVCYFSFERVPPGPGVRGISDTLPELAVEVKSPTNTWPKMLIKTGEYLDAGIIAVMLVDPDHETATVYRRDELHQTVHNGDEVSIPDVLPGFTIPLKRFFE